MDIFHIIGQVTHGNKFFEIKNRKNDNKVEGEKEKTENPNNLNGKEESKYQYVEDKDVTYPIYSVVNVQSLLRFRDNLGIKGTNVIGTIENDKIIKVLEKGVEKDRICLVSDRIQWEDSVMYLEMQ